MYPYQTWTSDGPCEPTHTDTLNPAYEALGTMRQNWKIIETLMGNFSKNLPDTETAKAFKVQLETAQLWARRMMDDTEKLVYKRIQEDEDAQKRSHNDVVNQQHMQQESLIKLQARAIQTVANCVPSMLEQMERIANLLTPQTSEGGHDDFLVTPPPSINNL